MDVVMEYRGRGGGTFQADLSPRERDTTEVELVEPLNLEPFGLDTPNKRFPDLVDLLLMKKLTTDLRGL